jgi:hypothetical protein
MDELLNRKERVIEKHLPKIMERKIKANKEILKLLTKALKDRKIEASVKIGILKKIQTGGSFSTDSSSKMDGEQKLEMVRLWMENAKSTIDDLRKDDKFTESYFKSIDKQMEHYQQELIEINKKLKTAKDEDESERLKREKEKIYSKPG